MKRILFVDDEPNVLDGLRRMLRPLRDQWEVAYAPSGPEALRILEKAPFDVVVSDMRMPGMDGVQLLTEVMKRHPHVVRIILSGQSDEATILRSVGPTHVFLSKPCDAELLKATMLRASRVRELMASAILRELVSKIDSLPSLPALYLELVEELKSPDSSIPRVAKIVSRDVGMSAKILQLVNSAFFGLGQPVNNPKQAVVMLGLRTVSSLALSVQVFSQLDSNKVPGFDAERLMSHSVATATLAKMMSKSEGLSEEMCDYAFTAGLLHDTGKLVLAAKLPERYLEVVAIAGEGQLPLWRAEQKALGASHAEIGAYLLGLWGFCDAIVEALAFHHDPTACPLTKFTPLAAVHVADALAQAEQPLEAKVPPPKIDMGYLESLGLTERLAVWQAFCRKTDTLKDVQ